MSDLTALRAVTQAAIAWHVHNTPLDPTVPADRSARADALRAEMREQAAVKLHEAVAVFLDEDARSIGASSYGAVLDLIDKHTREGQ